TRWPRDWSSDVCSSDLPDGPLLPRGGALAEGRRNRVGRVRGGRPRNAVRPVVVERRRLPRGCLGLRGRSRLGVLRDRREEDGGRSEERRVGKGGGCRGG